MIVARPFGNWKRGTTLEHIQQQQFVRGKFFVWYLVKLSAVVQKRHATYVPAGALPVLLRVLRPAVANTEKTRRIPLSVYLHLPYTIVPQHS